MITVLKNQASLQNQMLPFQVLYAEPKSKPAVPFSVSSLVLRFPCPLSVRVRPPRERNEASVGRAGGSIPFRRPADPPLHTTKEAMARHTVGRKALPYRLAFRYAARRYPRRKNGSENIVGSFSTAPKPHPPTPNCNERSVWRQHALFVS